MNSGYLGSTVSPDILHKISWKHPYHWAEKIRRWYFQLSSPWYLLDRACQQVSAWRKRLTFSFSSLWSWDDERILPESPGVWHENWQTLDTPIVHGFVIWTWLMVIIVHRIPDPELFASMSESWRHRVSFCGIDFELEPKLQCIPLDV